MCKCETRLLDDWGGTGIIQLQGILSMGSGFIAKPPEKEYRHVEYAILFEDIRFCKDIGIVDRIFGHFERMIKCRMCHVRSA